MKNRSIFRNWFRVCGVIILNAAILGNQDLHAADHVCLVAVVDKSRSMNDERRIDRVKLALHQLVSALPDDITFGITAFDSTPFIAVRAGALGPMRTDVQRRIDILFPSGKSAPMFAIDAVRGQLANLECRKHLQLVTDGKFDSTWSLAANTLVASKISISVFTYGPDVGSLDAFLRLSGGKRFSIEPADSLSSLLFDDAEGFLNSAGVKRVLSRGSSSTPAQAIDAASRHDSQKTFASLPAPDLKRPVTVDFQDTTLTSAIELLQQVTNCEISLKGIDDKSAGAMKVTIVVKDIPAEDAIRAIAKQLGLITWRAGDKMVISRPVSTKK